MDSNASLSKLTAAMMPFTAILWHDLRMLWSSWLVRLWLIATGLLAMVQLIANWRSFQTAPLIAVLLLPYIVFPWSLVVMMLSVNPLSGSRSGVAADGILSRPVTRYAYLLAAWTARVTLVLSVFLVVTVPAIAIVALAERSAPTDEVTVYGIVASLTVVALVLTLLVSVGFLLGTLFRNTLLAIVVLVFLWFPVNLVLNVFSLEEFSPISLTQALPTLLRQPWQEAEAEPPEPDLDATFRDALNFFSSLGGGSSPEPKPEERGSFFERGDYEDFSLFRVILGYGIPTLVSIALATFCFCLRDV
jgi:ABC-type transport system involved in multi-copper enzyme maturation permease subunit